MPVACQVIGEYNTMFMYFDPMYFLFIAPALLLGFWAQMRIRMTYGSAQKVAARLL